MPVLSFPARSNALSGGGHRDRGRSVSVFGVGTYPVAREPEAISDRPGEAEASGLVEHES